MTSTAASKAPMTVDGLVKVTNMTKLEIEQLQVRFHDLNQSSVTGGGGGDRIDRSRFRDLLCDSFGIDNSLIMDRVFRCFDVDADNYISFDEFVKGMSVYLRGKFDEQMKFCFRVYDLNGDRYISKEEMFQLLQNCLVKGSDEEEDGVKELVDLVLKKLDEDRDGRVSESDYLTAVTKEPLLLEAFGQCLPHQKAISAFLSSNPSSQSRGVDLIVKPAVDTAPSPFKPTILPGNRPKGPPASK